MRVHLLLIASLLFFTRQEPLAREGTDFLNNGRRELRFGTLSDLSYNYSENDFRAGELFQAVDWRARGSAARLLGHVCVEHVFVVSKQTSWSAKQLETVRRESTKALSYLRQEARKRGHTLTWHESESRVFDEDEEAQEDNHSSWTARLLRDASATTSLLPPVARFPPFECEQSFALMHVPRVGRSFALPERRLRKGQEEKAVVFFREIPRLGTHPERASTYVHEILHLFGADDLYEPTLRRLAAQERYPNEVMLRGGPLDAMEISDYTEYLIGWSETPGRELPAD